MNETYSFFWEIPDQDTDSLEHVKPLTIAHIVLECESEPFGPPPRPNEKTIFSPVLSQDLSGFVMTFFFVKPARNVDNFIKK